MTMTINTRNGEDATAAVERIFAHGYKVALLGIKQAVYKKGNNTIYLKTEWR